MGLKFTRLVDKDVIPTKVSQLENDSNYQNEEQVDAKVNAITKENLGLDKVDNTSDMDKPISTLMQKALDEKEDKSNLGELAYKDSISKSDIGLGNVNNVAITQEEVTQIGTNKTNIENTNKQVETNIQHISNAQSTANEALNIAKGRAKTKVFDTFGDMTNYLKSASKEEFKLGDNLLIKATSVPDYWISNILDNNSGIYGYYEISVLETTKVDLSNYYNKGEIDTKETNLNNKINEKADLSVVYTKSQVDSAFTSRDENIALLEQNKANKSDVPTKVSQLQNDEGYLKEHQSLANYYTKTQVDSELTKINAKNTEQDTSIANALSKAEEALEKANPTLIPETGYVDKIYVNTSLSREEVDTIIRENIEFFNELPYLVFEHKENDKLYKSLCVVPFDDFYTIQYNSNTIENGEYVDYYADIVFDNNGFKEDFNGVFEIKLKNNAPYKNNMLFVNHKLTELFSLTPEFGKQPSYVETIENNKNELKNKANKSDIPTKLPASDVYSWAKQPNKPTYTASEVGLGNVRNVESYSKDESDEIYYTKEEVDNKIQVASNDLENYKEKIGLYNAFVPKTGFIEKVYLNIFLPKEKIVELLSTLDFSTNTHYTIVKSRSTMYEIYVEQYDGHIRIKFAYPSYPGSTSSFHDTLFDAIVNNYKETNGFNMELIGEDGSVVFNEEAYPYETHNPYANEQLVDIFSIKSFNENNLVNKVRGLEFGLENTYTKEEIDKLKDKLGELDFAQPIRENEYIEKVYVNTSLTHEEIVEIFDELEISSGYSYYLYVSEDGKKQISLDLDSYIMRYYQSGMPTNYFYMNKSFTEDFVNNSNGIIEINAKNRKSNDIEHFVQNKKLTRLFSTTPIFGFSSLEEKIDNLEKTKSNKSEVYTKLEVDGKIEEINGQLVLKANSSDVYTRTEINNLLANFSSLDIEVVTTLPTTNISTTTIYLKPLTTSATQNVYEEYIYINNKWELIGTTQVDLSNYYKKSETYSKSEVDNKVNSKVEVSTFNEVLQGATQEIININKKVVDVEQRIDVGSVTENGAIPNSGTVDTFYINTSMSTSEVNALIDRVVTYYSSVGASLYYVFSNNDSFTVMFLAKIGTSYLISLNINGNMNNIYENGWVTSKLPSGYESGIELNIDLVSSTNLGGVNVAIGNKNSQLIDLFYTEVSQPIPINEEVKNNTKEIEKITDYVGVTSLGGAIVPNNGYIENVYFNTKLSIDEVVNLLSNLTYVGEDLLGFPVYGLLIDGNTNMIIASQLDGAYAIFNMDNSEFYFISGSMPDAPFEWVGWNPDFNGEIEINNTIMNSIQGLSVGEENDKLTKLFSLTPSFEEPKTLTERVENVENELNGYGSENGTTIPTNGMIKNVYFNTNLNSDEVLNIINKLNYIDVSSLGFVGYEAVFVYSDASMNYALGAVRNGEDYYISLITNQSEVTDFWSYGFGWRSALVNPLPINKETALSDLAPMVGQEIQNEALKNLFSITPFGKKGLIERVSELEKNGGGGSLPTDPEFNSVRIGSDETQYVDINTEFVDMYSEQYNIYMTADECTFGIVDIKTNEYTSYKHGNITYNNHYINLPEKSGTFVVTDGNGNLVFDGYNKGIVFSANGVDYPEIYFNDQDQIRIDCPTSISNLSVDEGIFVNGNLEFDDWDKGIQFNAVGSKIYENSDGDIFTIETPYRPVWKNGDEKRQVATLDDFTNGTLQNVNTQNERYSVSIGTTDGGLYIYDNVEDIETFYNSGYIINNGEIINLPNKSGTLATLDDIGTGGGSLPTNPTFESVKSSYIQTIELKNNQSQIFLRAYSGNVIGLGNEELNLQLTGYEKQLKYNGQNLAFLSDVEEYIDPPREIILSDDYSVLVLDLTSEETMLNSFDGSEFSIDDYDTGVPSIDVLNDITIDNIIEIVGTENSSLDLSNFEFKMLCDSHNGTSTLVKKEVELGGFIIYDRYVDNEQDATIIINHPKLAQYILNGESSINSCLNNHLYIGGKIPTNTLFRYDKKKNCWFVDFAFFKDMTPSGSGFGEGGTKIQILTWEDDD